MNTGLSDAFGLLWRLYFLLKYPGLPIASRDAILSSYDLERRATAKEVVEVASKLVRSTLSEAKSYVSLIEQNSGFITGMGVAYSGLNSPLIVESKRGIFEAGYRCPDLWLQEQETGATCRLYERPLYGRYILLVTENAAAFEFKSGNSAFLTIIRLVPIKAPGAGKNRIEKASHEEWDEDGPFGCPNVKDGVDFAVLVRPDYYIERAGEVQEIVAHLHVSLPGIIV